MKKSLAVLIGIAKEFQKMHIFEPIPDPQRKLFVITISESGAQKIILSDKKVFISRKSLKHIVERRKTKALGIIRRLPEIMMSPTKIVDNSRKRKNSLIFIKDFGKDVVGVVLETAKTPGDNRIVSAFPISIKAYGKMIDISGRAEFPPFELPKENSQQILSDVGDAY